MNTNTLRVAAASIAVLLITFTTPVNARGLICGAVQMYHYGISDPAYRLARHWLTFQRTVPQPGAVVVFSRGHDGRSGHVARINNVIDNCTAVVTDEKGTYTRNICHRQLGVVMPGSGGYHVQMSARRKHGKQIAYNYAYTPPQNMDRGGIGSVH